MLSLDLIRDGRVFRAPQSVIPDPNTVAEVPYPPDVADRLSLRAYFSTQIPETSSGLSNVFVDPSDAGALSDVSFMMPPDLGLDTASRKISWTSKGGDGATAQLYWRSQSGSSGSWSFVGPADAGTFILPELPVGDRFFAPLEAKPRSLLWSVNVFDYPVVWTITSTVTVPISVFQAVNLTVRYAVGRPFWKKKQPSTDTSLIGNIRSIFPSSPSLSVTKKSCRTNKKQTKIQNEKIGQNKLYRSTQGQQESKLSWSACQQENIRRAVGCVSVGFL